jgi:hypothetical protein
METEPCTVLQWRGTMEQQTALDAPPPNKVGFQDGL